MIENLKEFYESPDVDAETIGKVIFERRKKKGVSQEVLSGLADVGRAQFSAIEKGTRKPTYSSFNKICSALDAKTIDVLAEIESRLEK